MANRILRSRIRGTDFEAKVAAFAADMNQWRAHMRNVEQDPSAYQAYPSPQAEPDIVNSVASTDGEKFVPDFEIVDDSPSIAQLMRAKQDQLLLKVRDLEAAAAHAIMPVGKRRLFNMNVADVRKRDSVRRTEIAASHHETMKQFVRHQQRQTLEHNILVNETIRKANEAAFDEFRKKADEITKNPKKKFKFGMSASELADHVEKTCGDLAEKIGAAPDIDIDNECKSARPVEDQALLDQSAAAQAMIDAIERHAAELAAQIEDLTAETIDAWAPSPFPT